MKTHTLHASHSAQVSWVKLWGIFPLALLSVVEPIYPSWICRHSSQWQRRQRCNADRVQASVFVTACKDKDMKDMKDMKQSFRVVDVQQVIIKSGLAAQEAEHLKNVRQKLVDGLTLAQSQYKNLSDDKKHEAQQSDQNMIEHQWQNERLQASQAVNLIVQKTLNDWRSKNMISVIIPRQQVISVDESLDITPLIVKELNGAKVKFGKLPEIKLKDKESQKPLASVQSK